MNNVEYSFRCNIHFLGGFWWKLFCCLVVDKCCYLFYQKHGFCFKNMSENMRGLGESLSDMRVMLMGGNVVGNNPFYQPIKLEIYIQKNNKRNIFLVLT